MAATREQHLVIIPKADNKKMSRGPCSGCNLHMVDSE